MRLNSFHFLIILLLSTPVYILANLKDENLLQNLPDGYKVDFQTKQGNMLMMEMVPTNQSVNNWNEMITSQTMLGLQNTTPQAFQSFMQKSWADSCKNSEFASVAKGKENGYPFSIWIQVCPLNQSTGKPEHTFFKAIKGNDSFYIVQKAFKYKPSKQEVIEWMQYFKTVTVCDTRISNSLCPKLDK